MLLSAVFEDSAKFRQQLFRYRQAYFPPKKFFGCGYQMNYTSILAMRQELKIDKMCEVFVKVCPHLNYRR